MNRTKMENRNTMSLLELSRQAAPGDYFYAWALSGKYQYKCRWFDPARELFDLFHENRSHRCDLAGGPEIRVKPIEE